MSWRPLDGAAHQSRMIGFSDEAVTVAPARSWQQRREAGRLRKAMPTLLDQAAKEQPGDWAPGSDQMAAQVTSTTIQRGGRPDAAS